MKILRNPQHQIRIVLIFSILIQLIFSIKIYVQVAQVQAGLSVLEQRTNTYSLKQEKQETINEQKEMAKTFANYSLLSLEHSSEDTHRVLQVVIWMLIIQVILISVALILNKV